MNTRAFWLSFVSALVMLSALSAVRALEIPLDRHGSSSSSSAPTVAFVDVKSLFAEHPMARRMKDEFTAEMARRKAAIVAEQAAVCELEKVAVSSAAAVDVLRAELDRMRGAAVVQSSAAAQAALPATPPNPQAITRMEENIRLAEKAVADLRAEIVKKAEANRELITRTRRELTALEQKQSAQVMKDLYALIETVSKEEGITVVLDYEDVLYGQSMRDITDKVRERLRGR